MVLSPSHNFTQGKIIWGENFWNPETRLGEFGDHNLNILCVEFQPLNKIQNSKLIKHNLREA